MRRYAIYDKTTGEIIKAGWCSNRDFGVGQGLKPNEDVLGLDKFERRMDVTHRVVTRHILGGGQTRQVVAKQPQT